MRFQRKNIFLAILLFLTLFNIFLQYSSAQVEQFETYSPAEKDCYVNSGVPDANYGDTELLYVGNDSSSAEYYVSYFYFDLSSRPDNLKKTELSLIFVDVETNMEISIYETNGTWKEGEITWNTKPNTTEKIGDVEILESGEVTLEITDYVQDLDELYISVNLSSSQYNDYLLIHSREGANDEEDAPKIIFTYEMELDFSFFYWFLWGIIGIIFVGVIIIMFIIFLMRRNRPSARPASPRESYPQVRSGSPQTSIKPEIGFCPHCGAKISIRGEFCTECGKKI